MAVLGVACLVGLALTLWTMPTPTTAAGGSWSTFQHDNARSGVDPDQPPATTPTLDWHVTLDGLVFAQPLVVGNTVIAATQNDSVYAFDAISHAQLWHTTVGTPATSGIPNGCGDPHNPIGVLGTPVVDTTGGVVYVAALTQQNGGLQYMLLALNLSTGGVMYNVPINPTSSGGLPAFDASIQDQRSALTFANGRIYVEFGGLSGDCDNYRGWVWSAVASNGSAPLTYEVPATAAGAGIWAPPGASVDNGGNLYVATGNSKQSGAADHSESVIKLSPSVTEVGYFTASDWASLNNGDTDIGSFGPLQLTTGQFPQYNGLVFQSGKNGQGYILNGANLGGVGHEMFSGFVCGNEILGGAAYVPPNIYIGCSSELDVVHLSTGGPVSFTASTLNTGYTGEGAGGGSTAIFSGGKIWNLDIGGSHLVMTDPNSGQAQAFPLTRHPVNFASPSSGAGHIFVPAGDDLDAFSIGGGGAPPPTPTPTPPPAGTGFITTLGQPQRLADTRSSGGPIATGQARCFAIAGVGSVPAGAAGAVLNVTAVDYPAAGWLTVYPSGQSVPGTSTLNFDTSEYALANGIMVRLGGDGQVCVAVGTINSASGSADVVLDATGYLSSTALTEVPLLTTPQRLVDTRSNGGPISTGQSRCFMMAGVGNVPTGAAGVLLNITAVSYTNAGWLTVYPNGQSVPPTSTLNFDPAEYAIANNSIVRVGTSQAVCVQVGTPNSAPGSANVVIDVTGYLTSQGLANIPLLTAPQRSVDTRTTGGPIPTGGTRCFQVAGQGGVPGNAADAVLNVTAVGYGTQGWLSVYPSNAAAPASSTLNFDPSVYAVANSTLMHLGSDGQVCVAVGTINSAPGSTHVVVDVSGSTVPH